MSFVLEVVEQYLMQRLMLKMKLQHLGHLMWSFLSSGTSPWIQGKEHKILNVLPNIVF